MYALLLDGLQRKPILLLALPDKLAPVHGIPANDIYRCAAWIEMLNNYPQTNRICFEQMVLLASELSRYFDSSSTATFT